MAEKGRPVVSNVEVKAHQLVTTYGTDMAQVQAAFFARRASGMMQSWWNAVGQCIRRMAARTAAA
jgi:hypothetical protein